MNDFTPSCIRCHARPRSWGHYCELCQAVYDREGSEVTRPRNVAARRAQRVALFVIAAASFGYPAEPEGHRRAQDPYVALKARHAARLQEREGH